MVKCYIRHRMADNNIDDISSLVELTGVSRNTINKLYRNSHINTIKIDTLVKICDALNCTLSELIEYKPSAKS